MKVAQFTCKHQQKLSSLLLENYAVLWKWVKEITWLSVSSLLK